MSSDAAGRRHAAVPSAANGPGLTVPIISTGYLIVRVLVFG
jgi:hypothetical protein